MITQDKITGNSIIQSSYNYFCECLECYRKEQPAFLYTVNYGTNSNGDYAEDTNKYNFVVYNDVPELIPSHWVEINGETEILYAGYINLAVSFVNPMPMSYNDDFIIETIEQEQFIDSTYNQNDFNELSDDDNDKIEYGVRLLEGFARFMRRKGIIVDNFKFTSNCDVPSPDGMFENGFYRLTGVLDIQLKFAMQNTLGKALFNGEDTRVWIKVGNDKYEEIYNVLDLNIKHTTVDKTFPIFNNSTTTTISNQLSRVAILDCPEFDFGGNKIIREILNSGTLDQINNITWVYFDGKKYNTFTGVPTGISAPLTMDKFNGTTVTIAIKSDITEFVGDLNG